MKTNKRIFAMMVASLLMATSVYAGGMVTIVKKLDGTVNADAGVVNANVEVYDGKCQLTVSPASGNYVTVDYITAERIIDAGMAQAPRRAPEMSNLIAVTAETPTADPSGETKYVFDIPASNSDYDVEVTVDFQTRTAITGAAIVLAQATYTFSGEAFEPAVTSVTLGSTTLTTAEYSVSYEDNIDAGTATVKVTGQRTYTGEATTTFIINKAPLSKLKVLIEGWTYGAQANTPTVNDNWGGGAVTYTYRGINEDTFSATVPTNAGNYVVKAAVAETANYAAGEATAEFAISKAPLSNLAVSITGWTYGDNANTPTVSGNLGNGAETITYRGVNQDTFSATVPTNAGSYEVKAVVAETPNYQSGEATKEFVIAQADLALVTIDAIADQDWTGEAITPDVVVKFKGNVVSEDDYTVTYENNINPGTATVKLSSKNVNFSEPDMQPTQTFEILGTEISMNGHTWITYVASHDMTIPAGLKAYVVSSVNGRNVVAQEIDRLPQATAILIQAVEVRDQYIATPWRGEWATFKSLLQFNEISVDVSSLTAENDIYVLYNNEFVKTTGGTIPPFSGYLPVAKGQAADSPLAITIYDEETTGVDRVSYNSVATEGILYNLSGLRVSGKPTNGLYILNGKKVVVK